MNPTILLKSGHRIRLIGVIKGLSSERVKVRQAFEKKPDFVALSISPEELTGLREYDKGKMDDNFILSDYEEIYAKHLSKWGSVEMPPPCFTESLKLSTGAGVKVGAVDMDEEKFTNAYCAYITGIELLRHSLRKSILRNFEIKAETPEEFVLKWDKKVNRISGFRKLEETRERYMAKRLLTISEKFADILAFIDLERVEGVTEMVKNRPVKSSGTLK